MAASTCSHSLRFADMSAYGQCMQGSALAFSMSTGIGLQLGGPPIRARDWLPASVAGSLRVAGCDLPHFAACAPGLKTSSCTDYHEAWPGLLAMVLRRVATFGRLVTSPFPSGGWTSSMGACFGLASRRTLRKGMLPLCVRRWSGSPAVGYCGTCIGRRSKMRIPLPAQLSEHFWLRILGPPSAIEGFGTSYPKPSTPGQAGVPASGVVQGAGSCGGGHYPKTACQRCFAILDFNAILGPASSSDAGVHCGLAPIQV